MEMDEPHPMVVDEPQMACPLVAGTPTLRAATVNSPSAPASQAASRPIKLRNLLTGEQVVDVLHTKYKHNNKSHGCNETRCLGAMMNPKPVENKVRSISETLEHAKDFINNYYASIKRLDSPAHTTRLQEIEEQLRTTETYYLKETELIYGAKLAWRNASRCIGRIQWSKLQVFDARFTTNVNEMFEALCNHIKYATNKGSLRSAITILPARVKSTKSDWRIWNSQLIGYAGYRNKETGQVIGDPANADITEVCQRLGWKGKGTRFDVLPLVLSANGNAPQMFPLPEDLVLRVKIKHPKFKWFEELGLEWYALPAVANMMLDVGGLQFTAAPFSGWYMVTEIGTRDLGDTSRYNVLEEVAQRMGLNTTSNMSLWKDQAVVELNIAVLDSFQSAGVTIVDHHTASETFMTHLNNEQRLRGGCPADWVWLVPPTGGSTTQVFHQEMVNYHLLPNYEYMEPVWKNFDWLAWEKQQQERQDKLDERKRVSSAMAACNSAAAASEIMSGIAAGSPLCANGLPLSPNRVLVGANGELTPRKLRFKEIARAVKFTSKLFGKALSRRIKATILYATETGKSERFANKLAQTFSCAFNVHLMSMSDYDMTCLEHEALLLIVTSTFGNGDPPENGELFAKHLAAVKLTGDTSPDLDSINSVSTNPFFQMLSEDHKDSVNAAKDAAAAGNSQQFGEGNNSANKDKQGTTSRENSLAGSGASSTGSGSSGSSGSSLGGGGATSTSAAAASASAGAADNDSATTTKTKAMVLHEHHTNIRPLSNVRFGVFALGSTAYPHFCAYGRYVDQTLGELGAERILKCTCGDELCGQEKAFNEWSNEIFKTACDVFCLTDSIGPIEERPEMSWSPLDVKFVPVELIGESEKNNNLLVNSLTPNTQRQLAPEQKLSNFTKSNEVLTSKKTIVRNLMSITNKRIIPFTMRNRIDLHKFKPEENLQTLRLDLESDWISGPGTISVPNSATVGPIAASSGGGGGGGGGGSTATQANICNSSSASGSKSSIATNKLQSASSISFEAGDHVAIYPINKLEVVQKILDRMQNDLLSSVSPTQSDKNNNQNNIKQHASDTKKNDDNIIGSSSSSSSSSSSTIISSNLINSSSSSGSSSGSSSSGNSKKQTFDFDQVFTVLVKRENMDLTPATPMAAAQQGSAPNGEQQTWITHDRLPVTSIREALTRYLDITSPPNQEFLLILSRQTSDPEEKKRLQQLARNFTIYEEWKIKKVPDLLSVLEEFKTIKFEPALVTQIPLMKPRFYSVSGTSVSLTVGVVRFKTASGEKKEGLCSNYLNTVPIDPATYIYGYIRSAPAFHMPQDKSIPMILISAGTGIAPFRSFWQQRYADMYKFNSQQQQQQHQQKLAARGSSLPSSSKPPKPQNVQTPPAATIDNRKSSFGRIELYFGCRNSNYILYRDELDEMYENGVLSSVSIAFSRPSDCDVIEPPKAQATVVIDDTRPTNSTTNTTGATSASNTESSTLTKTRQSSHVKGGSIVASIKQERKRVYVQQKLLEDSEHIYKLIMLYGAHVYVCGDVAMADGVYKTLASIFNDSFEAHRKAEHSSSSSSSQNVGDIISSSSELTKAEDGESVLMILRNLNRYHEDIFGAKQM